MLVCMLACILLNSLARRFDPHCFGYLGCFQLFCVEFWCDSDETWTNSRRNIDEQLTQNRQFDNKSTQNRQTFDESKFEDQFTQNSKAPWKPPDRIGGYDRNPFALWTWYTWIYTSVHKSTHMHRKCRHLTWALGPAPDMYNCCIYNSHMQTQQFWCIFLSGVLGLQMHLRCVQLPPRCLQMSLDPSRCIPDPFQMSIDASRSSPDVSQIPARNMPPDASQMFQVLLKVPRPCDLSQIDSPICAAR